ncbi:MAG: AIR carboxylase family protein, partial [Verrucomicrobia bacterium]|nr:AIR carboxylase family protein [Verrucomicrobiota bacterium]
VIGVPVKSSILNGVDSLLSIVQMPAGVPVLTVAIGEAGAKNAALAAISILSLSDARLAAELVSYRERQTRRVLETELPE